MNRTVHRSTRRASLCVALVAALSTAAAAGGCSGCNKGEAEATVAVPPSSDPNNADLVPGALVAATEKNGGVRLLKILRVDVMPEPLGVEYRMVAYDAVGKDFAEVARLRKKGGYKPVVHNMQVRLVDFRTRDYRVLAVEPLTDAEKARLGG